MGGHVSLTEGCCARGHPRLFHFESCRLIGLVELGSGQLDCSIFRCDADI